MYAWIDGELLADPEAGVISVTDHGFTVGDGVFEAVKVIDGRPFALDLHLARLVRSATGLGLDAPDRDAV
ncbi:MAG: aminotransferase class IV, partial [Actinobacteria bacterium]|nr:aminotransferase class IV [Actinomycetota bacterium]